MGLKDFLKEFKRQLFGAVLMVVTLSLFMAGCANMVTGRPFIEAFITALLCTFTGFIALAFMAWLAVYFDFFD